MEKREKETRAGVFGPPRPIPSREQPEFAHLVHDGDLVVVRDRFYDLRCLCSLQTEDLVQLLTLGLVRLFIGGGGRGG